MEELAVIRFNTSIIPGPEDKSAAVQPAETPALAPARTSQ